MPESDCLPPDVTATDFVGQMAAGRAAARRCSRERAAEVLRHVGLYEERYRPMGGYSTGMKQRVKLAQALVHDPRLLLLDEPTNGLDPAGRDEMLSLVKRTGTEFGIAVVVASHLLGEIERVRPPRRGRRGSPDPVGSADDVHRTHRYARGRRRGGRAVVGGALLAAGVEAVADRTVRDPSRGRASIDLVRDTVADLGLPLVRIEQRRRGLEELFQ